MQKLTRLPSLNNGYYIVKTPAGYPRNGFYAPEHRVVYWMHHGSLPPDGWHIHHVNGNPLDNRIENLQAVLAKEHVKMAGHLCDVPPAPHETLVCYQCETEFKYLERRVRAAEVLVQTKFFCGKSCQVIYQNQFKKGTKTNYPKNRKSSGKNGVNLTCNACNKEYYVPKYKELISKTCSLPCSYTYKSMTRTGVLCPDRANKTAYVTLECHYCHKEFERMEREVTKSVKAGSINCFCSSRCITIFNNANKTAALALTQK